MIKERFSDIRIHLAASNGGKDKRLGLATGDHDHRLSPTKNIITL
jgi:hypothetical protein